MDSKRASACNVIILKNLRVVVTGQMSRTQQQQEQHEHEQHQEHTVYILYANENMFVTMYSSDRATSKYGLTNHHHHQRRRRRHRRHQ